MKPMNAPTMQITALCGEDFSSGEIGEFKTFDN